MNIQSTSYIDSLIKSLYSKGYVEVYDIFKPKFDKIIVDNRVRCRAHKKSWSGLKRRYIIESYIYEVKV